MPIPMLLRTGRPRDTLPEDDLAIVQAASNEPFKPIPEILIENDLNYISLKVARNRLAEAGFKNCVAARRPLLTPQHKAARLKFAGKINIKCVFFN
jgi:hypothetical protein